MMDKKTIAVDFDGVLYSFESGWTGDDLPDPPVEGAIAWLIQLIYNYDISIYSARNESPDTVAAMKRWLVKYGLLWVDVRKIDFPTKKPACNLLIDDRCFCFKGQFPTVDEIDNFVPWHGKGIW